jgi:hypothetical protein
MPDPENLPRLTGPARLIVMVPAFPAAAAAAVVAEPRIGASSDVSEKQEVGRQNEPVGRRAPYFCFFPRLIGWRRYVELWVTSTRFGEKQKTKVHANAGRRAIFRQTFHFDIAQPHKEFLFFRSISCRPRVLMKAISQRTGRSAMCKSSLGSDKLIGQADLALGHVSSNMTHKQIILMTDGGDDAGLPACFAKQRHESSDLSPRLGAGLLHVDLSLHPLRDQTGVTLGAHRQKPSPKDAQPTPPAPPTNQASDDRGSLGARPESPVPAPSPVSAKAEQSKTSDEMNKLVDMGFSRSLCKRAIDQFKTAEASLQVCVCCRFLLLLLLYFARA